MLKPSPSTYPAPFKRYIDQVPDEELFTAFKNQLPAIKEFLTSISEEKSLYAYAEGKWTLREVLQHIIDGERVFTYRALCFARKESASLPSFEENEYAANSNANSRTWQSLADELLAVRKTTEMLFESFTEEALNSSGIGAPSITPISSPSLPRARVILDTTVSVSKSGASATRTLVPSNGSTIRDRIVESAPPTPTVGKGPRKPRL